MQSYQQKTDKKRKAMALKDTLFFLRLFLFFLFFKLLERRNRYGRYGKSRTS